MCCLSAKCKRKTIGVYILQLDCKTVGFFLKISKEIGKAWRKSLTREAREPHTPYADLLFDCSRVKIRTVLQSILQLEERFSFNKGLVHTQKQKNSVLDLS